VHSTPHPSPCLPPLLSLSMFRLQGVQVRRQATTGLGATQEGALFGIDLLEMEKGLAQTPNPTPLGAPGIPGSGTGGFPAQGSGVAGGGSGSEAQGMPGSGEERVRARPWHVVGFEDAGTRRACCASCSCSRASARGRRSCSRGQVQPHSAQGELGRQWHDFVCRGEHVCVLLIVTVLFRRILSFNVKCSITVITQCQVLLVFLCLWALQELYYGCRPERGQRMCGARRPAEPQRGICPSWRPWPGSRDCEGAVPGRGAAETPF